MPTVRWVGVYEPAYRLTPDLLAVPYPLLRPPVEAKVTSVARHAGQFRCRMMPR